MDSIVTLESTAVVTLQELLKQLKDFPFDEEDLDMLSTLTEEAAKIARPKAVYKKASITELGEDYIIAENVKFTSALLRENVGKCSFIVPYAATCGRELYDWSKRHQVDFLKQYAADMLMELYLGKMFLELKREIRDKFYGKQVVSSMTPGSLENEWPITQQKPLFALLGKSADKIGITLTESFLMLPEKSGSGIFFYADQHFESCMLCTRLDCPKRRAKYRGNKEE